ncbi:MAG: NRDE family protein [Bacteroidota bacterium]
MCTVTFVPTKQGILLTSNRDEALHRRAIPPARYPMAGTELLYPKDADAGGTWIAVKDGGNAAVLLNGAFTAHPSMPPYRKSRGLMLLEILSSADPIASFIQMELTGIEPFTLILIQNLELYEARWDGVEKYCLPLDANSRHIWCSATLYDKAAREDRSERFRMWSHNIIDATRKDILSFHKRSEIVVNEDNVLKGRALIRTISITQVILSKSASNMDYYDLTNGNTYNTALHSLNLQFNHA